MSIALPPYGPPVLPPHALPAAAARGVLRVADRSWDGLVAVLALYLLFAVGRVHQVVPGLAAVRPALVAAVLAAVMFLLDGRRSRSLSGVLRLRPSRYLVALLGWMALTVPGALWPGGAFDVLLNTFAKVVITFILVAGAVRGLRDVERLMGAYFVGAAVYAVAVLLQVGGGADAWPSDALPYYDANDFATLAATAIPMGLYLAATRRPVGQRLVGAIGTGPLLVALASSSSRSGFLALAAVGVFVLVRMAAIPLRWRVSGAVALTLLFAATVGEKYWAEIKAITSEDDYNYRGEEGRLQIWSRGLDYITQRPVLGVGAGNFPVAEGTLSPLAERARVGGPVKWSAAHNSYMQVAAELGIPGLIIFLALVGSAFGLVKRVRRLPVRGPPATAETLAGALVAFLVGAVFLSLAYHEMLYVLLSLIAGTWKVARAAVRA